MSDHNMILGLHHTGLSVGNLDRAIEHYETNLGFEVAARFSVEDDAASRRLLDVDHATAKVALMRGATGYMELFEYAERPERVLDPAVFEAGIRHICIQAVDVETLFDQCMAAGGRSHARPSSMGTGALYAYIRDPEANIMELEGVPWGPAYRKEPWYAHTAFVTHDMDRLLAFYEYLTGVDSHDRRKFGPHKAFDRVAGVEGIVFEGAWIKLNNATLEFWQYSNPVTMPAERSDVRTLGWNHICLEVKDVSAVYDRLDDDGVELHGPIVRNGFGALFYGRDPDGNVFECIEIAPRSASFSVENLSGHQFLNDLERAFEENYSRG
ncbi:MAG: VOC family protein [Pseudomonadota bacterium]|nr:VOC family protein [Pseudomonadota bacterium]